MGLSKGKNSNAKAIMHKLASVEGEDKIYALTDRQAMALLQLTTYLRWFTRHVSFPSDLNNPNALTDWVDELDTRLMQPLDICALVAQCLQPDENGNSPLLDSIIEALGESEDFKDDVLGGFNPPASGENLSSNTGCDKDILWAECNQIVAYTHDLVEDFLQILEVQSNNIELMQNIELIPGLGTVFDELQIDVALNFADYLFDIIGEQYAANYTTTVPDGTAVKMVEAIFCECQSDCVVTVERIKTAYANLLSQYTTVSYDNLQEIIETIIGVNDNSNIVPYVTHFLVWGAASITGQFFSSDVSTKALKIILKIADNDASDDWIELTDCVTPDPDCEPAGTRWQPLIGGWGTKVGNIINADLYVPNGLYYLKAAFPAMEIMEAIGVIKLRFSRPVTDINFGYTSGAVIYQYTGAATNQITIDENTSGIIGGWPFYNDQPSYHFMVWKIGDAGENSAFAFTEFCYELAT